MIHPGRTSPARSNRVIYQVRYLVLNARWLAILCMGVALTGGVRAQAAADPVPEIQRLLRSGDAAHALERIDAALAKRPDDAAMRFRRGVALSILGRETEAMAVFRKLGEEHPEIPASYNNLAVLYGRQGDYLNARDALEKATRAYPDYGAAYANLGDVYAQLAMQAYSKALDLATPDPSLADKLARVKGVVSEAGPTAAATPLKVPQARTTAAATTEAAAASAAPATPTVERDVESAVTAWAAAWSRRDMDAYVASYTEEFAGNARSHAAWVQERTARILPRSRIAVDIQALRIELHGDHAVARFRQAYQSDSASETGAKVLKLVRRDGGRWLIEQETIGD
jgi:tetratricopeptide (TPR) repeat protein